MRRYDYGIYKDQGYFELMTIEKKHDYGMYRNVECRTILKIHYEHIGQR